MNFVMDKFKYRENYYVYGLTKELTILYILNYFEKNNENVLVLANTLYEANTYLKSFQAYTDDVLFFPMDDFIASVALAISPDLKVKRLETLERIRKENKKHIVVTSLMGYLKFLPNKEEDQSFFINYDPSPLSISREILLEKLEKYGYNRESLVTTTGEYAIRGFIIDIFPVGVEHPIRLEFFDDTIENIKEFDEETQLTTKSIDIVEIKKFNETIDRNASSIMDYLSNECLFLINESQIKISYKNLVTEMFEYNNSKDLPSDTRYMFNYDDIKYDKLFKLETINSIERKDSLQYISHELENFGGNLEELKKYCHREVKSKNIIFTLENPKQIDIIEDLFEDSIITNSDNILKNKINILKQKCNKGFVFENNVVITPYDIDKVSQNNIKYKNTIKIGRKIKNYADLVVGDYIVHEVHGVGIYKGLKTLKNGEYIKDYIELEYSGNDKVYLPVDNIDKLYKYSASGGREPKINKLNSTSWAKKKSETRKRIKDISGELIELYRDRQSAVGQAYKDYDDEFKFALDFPYSLTKDQEKTIQEIDYDLKSPAPMDRLLCGDVGYGKTEVAFRAMFKTVINGFQVSYLCPTTILSKQQYTSALERFKDFPIRIELLNRHISAKKVKSILADLEQGKIDIIIGTHKLFNDKIKYKKLGLLVIDEEQRFGVTHKEKIKKLKNDVNVLTLSATPIPRTLKMAMSGLRSLSILDTPPVNRYPIQTYVIEENDFIVRDAIYKELTRNGQVFILINSIEDLTNFKTKIDKLVPEARTICGHGQMSSEELNDIMESFIDGQYDVLICTTIIETGIDIPNVNTIIIIDSDRFGLSQLYQIRGRVGRSDKIAYSYLMYKPARILTETAIKRLESIKEFTELGSGYKIAMRDLAIRGAGDLLGREQAGFIEAVGLDLYTKMVNEEIQKIEGTFEDVEDSEDQNRATFNTSTHIKDDYVSDENIKIEIHKMINSIKTKSDFMRIKTELEDRFGRIDETMEIYMLEKCTETILNKLNIKSIIQVQKKITIVIPKETSDKINGEKLFMQSYNICPKFEISYKNKEIRISLNTDSISKNYIYYIYELLNTIESQINEV